MGTRFYEEFIFDMNKHNKNNFVRILISPRVTNYNKNFQANKNEAYISNQDNVSVTLNNDEDRYDRVENILRSNYENQNQQYSNDWRNRIRMILAKQSERKTFDIQQQGKELMLKLSKIMIMNQKLINKNNFIIKKGSQYEQQIPLIKLCEGKPKWEKCRDFVALLQLVSNGKISMSLINKETKLENCNSKPTFLVEPKSSECLEIMLMLSSK